MIKNTGQVEFAMKGNEDWRKFCGNTVQDRIDWNDDGCKMCPRWHSKDFCFVDCSHKASHVPKANIQQEKKKAGRSYLVKVRKS
jgi:hypothetical protein